MMNSRERFRLTMSYGRPDRVPYLEEGLRDDVLEVWQQQGVSAAELAALPPADRREEIQPELDPRPELAAWPKTMAEVNAMVRHLDPADPERLPDSWLADVDRWRHRDHVVMLRVHRGFFLSVGVYGWDRLLEVVYLLKDDPAVVNGMMARQAELAAAVAERVLSEVEIDAVIFSEPIGGNDRPLISPEMYRQVVLSSYRPILSVCQRHGVETIILRTYANIRVLIPSLLRGGFTCLWACEVNADEMDYRELRREHGRDLRLIGGIDLDVLRRGDDAIRRELEEKVPPLLADGGYVPLADGRVRADLSFPSYRFYRQLLAELITS